MGVELDPTLLREVINPWTLGADPEFAVLEPPSKLIANAGPYTVEANTEAGGIGQDHGGRVWEVRPRESHSAYAVTTNIWKLLKDTHLSKVEHFKWKGGALGARKQAVQVQAHHPLEDPEFNDVAQEITPAPSRYDTLGGHVHYGIQGLSGPQIAALNNVTTGLLNLDILPQKENTVRLKQGAYGRFNHDAVRTCGSHIEYRCAPSWLDQPGQAFAALTVYKLAAARPSTADWPHSQALKQSFLEWLSGLAQVDVDAFLLDRLIERRGFSFVQADPESNFRPRWRKEDLWAR